ncbi:D site-binding protein [Heterocephalus glaber]|uniref:D site-binding protein n=1 Tax=Heterocephalus glaber TaxID=10181 RepID=G5B892_HETGA|nr:D site-binding protein [Heterocephalus glaber]
MARPLSDRTPAPLLLGSPAGAPPGGGALLGLRSLLQGTSKPREPASCEFSPTPGGTQVPRVGWTDTARVLGSVFSSLSSVAQIVRSLDPAASRVHSAGSQSEHPGVSETPAPSSLWLDSLDPWVRGEGRGCVGGSQGLTPRDTPSPVDPDTVEVLMTFEPDPADLALSSIPGHETFDPRRHRFSEEELKPQPIMKKARKIQVPEEQKDEKYWSRRYKNNEAAKRSRDARRLKENQITVRAAFLEKENALLRQEVVAVRQELSHYRAVLSRYQAQHGAL